jgi:large subunit ribosomal protein L17
MRHRKAGRQFGRNTSHRRAMLRALTANLVAHERIETTDAKAKELRRVAERVITRAIRLGPVAYTPHDKLAAGDRARRLAAQRQVGRFLRRFLVVQDNGAPKTVDLVEKVFSDLARRFKDRPGGYTRIIKLGRRRGDNAPMALVEFVERPETAKARKSEAKAEAKPKKEPAAKAPKAVEEATDESETAKADEESSESAEAAEEKPKRSRKKAEPKAEGEADEADAEKPKKSRKKKTEDE